MGQFYSRSPKSFLRHLTLAPLRPLLIHKRCVQVYLDNLVMKDKIEKLKISGHVYIWRYSDNDKNYPGWNLTVDNMASEEISNLLDLMSKCEWTTSKKIFAQRPTDNEVSVPNNRRGDASWTTKEKITITHKTSESPDFWALIDKEDELEIRFGKQKLMELKSAIESIPTGKGDFSMADRQDENILTFWWRAEK